MDIPLEVAYKIASNLRDVAVHEKMHDIIIEIHELINKYNNTPHWLFNEEIRNSLNFMMTPALDENNAEGYFGAHCRLFIFNTHPLLSAIGNNMQYGANLYAITDNWEIDLNMRKETEKFIAYYAHHGGRNNMEN